MRQKLIRWETKLTQIHLPLAPWRHNSCLKLLKTFSLWAFAFQTRLSWAKWDNRSFKLLLTRKRIIDWIVLSSILTFINVFNEPQIVLILKKLWNHLHNVICNFVPHSPSGCEKFSHKNLVLVSVTFCFSEHNCVWRWIKFFFFFDLEIFHKTKIFSREFFKSF